MTVKEPLLQTANGSLWKENIEHVDFEKMKQAKILSLASIFNCPLLDGKTLVKIFKEAKAAGMTITADMIKPRLGETLDDIREALSYVDYFFPNFDEACLMTGETEESKVADKLFECGVKNVIMKIGKRGCYIRNAAGAMIVPACKGVTAIDTIGAGDNFASGFISALLQGRISVTAVSMLIAQRLFRFSMSAQQQAFGTKKWLKKCLKSIKKIISCNSNKSVTLRPVFVRMQGNPPPIYY